MKKRILAALLAAATMMSLTACGGSGSSTDSATGGAEASGDSKDVTIAYIVKAKSDEFWTTMEKGALAYAEEKGIQVDFQAPEKETDVEKQVQFVENAVIKGYDAIILSAADSKSLAPAVAKANAANIPVILVNDTMDQEALDAEGAKVETYVGIDQYEAASLAGTYAAENIKDGKILYLEGISGVAAHADRLNGFKDQCDAFSVIASQTARCDRNEAFNVMQNVLSSNPEVNVVWAINAEMGQGAIQAIEAAGLKPGEDIVIVSIDAAKGAFNAMIEGKMNCAVEHTPNFGELLMDTAMKIANGESVPETIEVEEGIFPADTAAQELPNRTY